MPRTLMVCGAESFIMSVYEDISLAEELLS